MTASIDRLRADISPAFAECSEHLYARFAVRPFRYARLAWLNHRWFGSIGINSTDPRAYAAIERWLIDWFGVAVPGDDDPPEQFLAETRYLHADRYGAPGGCTHGGSGRVGTLGAFNAKGIGRTPLVSMQSDWHHTHGCMFLEEAMREAIIAEIATRTFPHDAVPTIALIDTGERFRWRNGTSGDRRAITVRPAFLRLAHLMRSIYFGRSGSPESDQALDAACVQDMWKTVTADAVANLFAAIGRQYGFGHALRLWPGPMFASNVELGGKLVDFGSFRALPHWRRTPGESRSHGFGTATVMVEIAAKSLVRNGLRAGRTIRANDLIDRYRDGFERGYHEALARQGITPGSVEAIEIEAIRRQHSRQLPLLSDGITVAGLSPWTGLYSDVLSAEINAMIAGLDDGPNGDLHPIGEFIDQTILSANRSTI